ncbi:hypothetical protein HDU76_003299, partial [Blyttiomyces sp. JEL0837]
MLGGDRQQVQHQSLDTQLNMFQEQHQSQQQQLPESEPVSTSAMIVDDGNVEMKDVLVPHVSPVKIISVNQHQQPNSPSGMPATNVAAPTPLSLSTQHQPQQRFPHLTNSSPQQSPFPQRRASFGKDLDSLFAKPSPFKRPDIFSSFATPAPTTTTDIPSRNCIFDSPAKMHAEAGPSGSMSESHSGSGNGPAFFSTPQAKLVRPVAAAFNSTGILSKKSRPRTISATPTPETPTKKVPLNYLTSTPIVPVNTSTINPSPVNVANDSESVFLPPTPTRPIHSGSTFISNSAPNTIQSKKHRSPLQDSPFKNIKKLHLGEKLDGAHTEGMSSHGVNHYDGDVFKAPFKPSASETGGGFLSRQETWEVPRMGTPRTRCLSSPVFTHTNNNTNFLQPPPSPSPFASPGDRSHQSQIHNQPSSSSSSSIVSGFGHHNANAVAVVPDQHHPASSGGGEMMDCDVDMVHEPPVIVHAPPVHHHQHQQLQQLGLEVPGNLGRTMSPFNPAYTSYPRFLTAEYIKSEKGMKDL